MAARLISHYRVVRKIGAGGMGEVLLAQDTQLDRSVAIKLMSAELAKDPTQRKRFRAEAKAASGLSHPNICVIHEVGETEDGRPFLAMEYVEGQTLDVVMQQRRLKIREIIAIGSQVADALDAAHARGIVHRDIKPANIMLDQRGQAKVLDFGLAKRFAKDEMSASVDSTALTQPGYLIGTPHYMSPEQALGRRLDQRSDIFSLGVVLYELVTGQRPFLGKTTGETINKIVNQEAEPLGLENPIFSPALDAIIFKCLEKDPQKRYATAKALVEDLATLRADSERATAKIPGLQTPVTTPATVVEPRPEATRLVPAPSTAQRPGWLSTGRMFAIALALVAVGVLAWGLAHWSKSAQSTGVLAAKDSVASSVASQKSVAVLPFDNFSAERDTDYLSDGLTEEITAALSRVPGLRVAARNSAFTFKSKKEDLRKVGKTLGVATILEGSLRKSGPQIRVTAQLINAVDGYHLWSESYDSSMSDIIAVQEDIAGKIAERFELKSRNEAAPGTARRSAPNQEAYALYLKGLHFWNKRTKEDLETAAQLFNQAADKDPTYAPAFAGLALTHVLLPDYASRPQMEYFPLARAEAQKTLALDPASADAHAALALVDAYTRQYKAAEDEFKMALQLNPNHATAHHWYGVHLRETDRMDEAIAELRRAEALDPLSPIIKLNILTWQGYARQYDQSLEECNRDLEQFPDFALFLAARAWLLERKGRYPEALAQILKVRAGMTNSPYFLDYVGFIYARSGDETNARKCLAELEDWKTKGYAVRTGIAQVHLGLREYDLALDELNEALTQGDTVSGLLKDPTLDDLRPLPRFQSLLQKAGLKNMPP